MARDWAARVCMAVAIGLAGLLALLIPAGSAQAGKFHVLYSFSGGSDGCDPYAGVTMDKSGNLYGTAAYCGTGIGYGTVFEIPAAGGEATLYAFAGGGDGLQPHGDLIEDRKGNLYGTTSEGGAGGGTGFGTVFKLSPDGSKTVLYAFTGGTDGGYPYAGLVRDKAGNLYGTATYGGASGNGVVFKVAPTGGESVLYAFQGGNDGSFPFAGLIADSAGNLYGTTEYGGGDGCFGGGCGTVFELTPSGTETVLYAFSGSSDGAYPEARLTQDTAGNFYGTVSQGGANSNGAVFELTPTGNEAVLYSFTGGNDGGAPTTRVVLDSAGNLYGTTGSGGSSDYGVVFKVSPEGTETVLHAFDGTDGALPYGDLIAHRKRLVGTTLEGGAYNSGTVFALSK